MEIQTLYSGSKGNATVLTVNGTHILIDCGGSYARLKSQLNKIGLTPKNINAVIITHSHDDHIKALPAFLLYNSATPVYVSKRGYQSLYEKTYFDLQTFEDDFTLLNIDVKVYYCHHDAPCCNGFRFSDGVNSVVYVTDTGCVDTPLINFCSGCNTLVIESNHDFNMLVNGKYPYQLKKRIAGVNGHLSNDQTCQLLQRILPYGTKNIVLAHLSEQNNTPQLAYDAVNSLLGQMHLSQTVKLVIATQSQISEEIKCI